MPRRLVLITALGLAGCAAAPERSLPRWQDAAALTEAAATLCELDTDCADLRIELLDLDRPVAEIRAGFHIVLSRGLWQRTANAEERRFIIAHELGHRALGHFRPRDHAARLPQELEADTWAAAALCASGHSSLPGRQLLQRLLQEVEQATPGIDETLRTQALTEYRQRIAALADCGAS